MHSYIFSPAKYDSEWDDFLAKHPAGHYTQSSLWGQLKANFGWVVHRILIKNGTQIVGGAQLLTKRLPVYGKIGYITKGPLISPENPEVFELIFNEINKIAKKQSIFLLSIQPPCDGTLYEESLKDFRYQSSCYYVIPPSTVMIDLYQTQEQILSQMKRTTRQNIRAAQSRGVMITEGSEANLSEFCQLKRMTESRSNFLHYDQCYYEEAWRQLSPKDHIKLWLAYYGDELLAGLMTINFGQSVVYAWAGSSGAYTDKRPNDLLFWHVMMWAKDHGYHYCDLGGISPIVANQLKLNQEPPDCKEKGIARYKLGFGPMTTFPPSYDRIYSLRPEWLFRKAISFAWRRDRSFVSKFVRGVKD